MKMKILETDLKNHKYLISIVLVQLPLGSFVVVYPGLDAPS